MEIKSTVQITFHHDAGHGWYQVPKDLCDAFLKITDKITRFSYQNNLSYFLEEDCDAAILFSALDTRGIKYNIINKHVQGESSIRRMARVNA
jgi:hypothetical protein